MNSQYHYERKHLEDIQRLKKFTLMDDIFFSKCMDGQTACMELILTLILNEPSIKVLNVRSQEDIYNLLYRSIRLDVKAETSDQRIINVEIQRTKQGAGQKRMRFHASMLDVNELEKG